MKNAYWLIGALLAGCVATGATVYRLRAHDSAGAGASAGVSAKTAKKHEKLGQRVDDPKSPEFQAWLSDVKQVQLQEDEVLDLFDSNLSSAQKNALLDAHLRELSKSGAFPAPERWNQRLSEAVLRTDFDLDLGHKTGRILGHTASPRELAELEAEYKKRGPSMTTGNKLAIVTASRNPEFVRGVVDDATEPLEVREAAVERVAEVDDPKRLEAIAAADSTADPVLKVTSVGALAEKAETQEELTKAMELGRKEPAQDSFGRTAFNVAQTRASESSVDGKSSILFQEWKTALQQISGKAPPEAQLIQTLVTGKAFSRALWTEANPETAAQLIDGGLVPTMTLLLDTASGPEQAGLLQALAEFASDYGQECAVRAPDACANDADRRSSYRAELKTLVAAKIAGTSLAFYAQRL